jgi:hypothetical protein
MGGKPNGPLGPSSLEIEIIQPSPSKPKDIATIHPDRMIHIFPAEMVEGLLASTLFSISASVECLRPGIETKLTRLANVKASYAIAQIEIENALEALKHHSDASLRPKHKSARDVLKVALETLLSLEVSKAKQMRNRNVLGFARWATSFLTTYHLVLLEGTSQLERISLVEGFKGDPHRANP